MDGDLIFYQFSRVKMEQGDFRHFLGQSARLSRPRPTSGGFGRVAPLIEIVLTFAPH
jgi:hypothetical protein